MKIQIISCGEGHTTDDVRGMLREAFTSIVWSHAPHAHLVGIVDGVEVSLPAMTRQDLTTWALEAKAGNTNMPYDAWRVERDIEDQLAELAGYSFEQDGRGNEMLDDETHIARRNEIRQYIGGVAEGNRTLAGYYAYVSYLYNPRSPAQATRMPYRQWADEQMVNHLESRAKRRASHSVRHATNWKRRLTSSQAPSIEINCKAPHTASGAF